MSELIKVKSTQRLVVWIKNELRVQDNLALWNACRDSKEVIPLYVFDETFRLYAPAKRQVILDGLREMKISLQKLGGDLVVREGNLESILTELLSTTQSDGVYCASSFEPYSRERDLVVKSAIESLGKQWVEFQDHLLFDPSRIKTSSGTPYLVFTAFKNTCRSMMHELPTPLPALRSIHTPELDNGKIPEDILSLSENIRGGERVANKAMKEFLEQLMGEYHTQRDIPSDNGTSRLSHHLSVGSLSIRQLFHETITYGEQYHGLQKQGVQTFQNELLWRDFFYQVMWHYPHVVHSSFKKEFDRIEWTGKEAWYKAWCTGMTGYPIVDAAMRQLNTEYWMHNRARMIVASFLTKDLHIDWRRGEEYFLSKLVDGDVALNNAGWQWSAGTGTDAQPWFRIFNPVLQGKKFDVSGKYVRKYIPELRNVPDKYIHEPWGMPNVLQQHLGVVIGKTYPKPIVSHEEEREKTLELYKKVKKEVL